MGGTGLLNPFRAPKSLPTLNSSQFVPFPVVKGLSEEPQKKCGAPLTVACIADYIFEVRKGEKWRRRRR